MRRGLLDVLEQVADRQVDELGALQEACALSLRQLEQQSVARPQVARTVVRATSPPVDKDRTDPGRRA